MNTTGKGGFGDHPEHAVHVGRPKKGQSLTEKILKKLEEKNISLEQIIADMIAEKDSRAVLHTYDHIDGRPVQKNILGQDEDDEFIIRHKYKGDKDED